MFKTLKKLKPSLQAYVKTAKVIFCEDFTYNRDL